MEPKIYSVTELNLIVKHLLEETFIEVWVEGEISGFKESSLGHIYFDLKDSDSIISCVIYKGFSRFLKFEPENGLLVKIRAQVTAYSRQSKYQLNVKEMLPGKIGPLQLAFEQLKKKLQAEGLFDRSRKKPIPMFPQKIAVVTSLHGAAIKDILSILGRRYPNLNILICPVKVQGEGAKEEISGAIDLLNKNFRDIDVMLIGRGGGSIEDLWAFNEEMVARAIANSRIPVISCVGHETDFTIADFVADMRASTPSNAAELVVQNKEEIRQHLRNMEKRLIQSLKIFYENLKGRFIILVENRIFRNPEILLINLMQRLDNINEVLMEEIEFKIKSFSEKLRFETEKLNNLSPYFPLSKGYALARRSDNSVVKDASVLVEGENLSLQFKKGKAETKVVRIK
ncbi:MAG: exodeoxyribonuclease VII large subunit [Elusimicrobia bacterium]|nr:exodeoxyribonuclease VII large subunit [Elusimicrobiota bacterium]